jgi:hypothetical protein
MPPKKTPSVSATPAMKNASSSGVGAKRAPVSEDPKVQARRDAARESYAKKKASSAAGSAASSAAASSAAGSAVAKKKGRPPGSGAKQMGTATASGAATVANPTFIMNTGNNTTIEKLTEATASATIGRALKKKLARQELAELKQNKKFGVVDEELLTSIQIPYRDAKKFFSKDLAMLKYINYKHKRDNDGQAPEDISLVELEYIPFANYDYFLLYYSVPEPNERDSTNEQGYEYRTKVPRNRDTDYSDYLYNKYITKGVMDYEYGRGSGSIPAEGDLPGGKKNPYSSNKSSVGTKSDAVSAYEDSSDFKSSKSSKKGLPSPSWSVSSSISSKKGTNSSNSSDSYMTAELKRFRRDKAAGKYPSSSSSSKESLVYDEDLDTFVSKKRGSSKSIGKGSSSSSKVAGSRRL